MLTIEQALDEAYKNAGSNAYFGNGFKAGVEFAQRWVSVEEELPEIDESGESDLILMKIDHFVYVGNYNEDGECHRKCRRNVIENVIEILRKIKWLK